MYVYLIGSEFSGKTTLASKIVNWQMNNMTDVPSGLHFHDHFSVPCSELDAAGRESYKASPPQVKEMFQRFMITYHNQAHALLYIDSHRMGFFIEEAVYAPLYYGYGGKGGGSPERSPEGQRTKMARNLEKEMMEANPNFVLVLMKASPDIIRARMRENKPAGSDALTSGIGDLPPTREVVQEKDIEYVLRRFEEEFEGSLIRNKLVLDTTSATVEETLAEFLEKHKPFITEADRERMRSYQAGHKVG